MSSQACQIRAKTVLIASNLGEKVDRNNSKIGNDCPCSDNNYPLFNEVHFKGINSRGPEL